MKATKASVSLASWRLGLVLAAVGLVALAATCSAMSIEAEPVKVTHRNSGPRYDIDEVERTRLASANQEQAPPATPPPQRPDRPSAVEGANEAPVEDAVPIGHVAIRRIFLFPMVRPAPADWSQPDSEARETPGQPGGRGERENDEHEPMPSMFAKPFWPFMTPARPAPASHQDHERPHRPHLFGADEASRSPSLGGEHDQDKAESGPERDQAPAIMGRPVFDPIQMMVDMMHQAISSQLAPNFTDLIGSSNKGREPASGSSSNNNNNDNSPAESSDERPQLPAGVSDLVKSGSLAPKNETREDIVEIDGKKYLRKTVTNRHVGENIIFMTRRLIFVPLNETDSTTTTTDTVATTTPESPATTGAPVAGGERESAAANDRVGANKPAATTDEPTATATTTTTTTTTEQAPTTSQAPTTPSASSPTTMTPASSEQPTSSEPSVEPTTNMPKSSWVERASEAIGKAAERLTEAETGPKSTAAPAANNDAEKPARRA